MVHPYSRTHAAVNSVFQNDDIRDLLSERTFCMCIKELLKDMPEAAETGHGAAGYEVWGWSTKARDFRPRAGSLSLKCTPESYR